MNQPPASSPIELRALLADDDAGIRLTLSALLEQKAYVVTAVDNGMAAVEALAGNVFDIVLLDIRMPQMDGFDACQSIRELENGKNVPILMLTGQDDTASIKRAFEVGATDFVAKPINLVLMGFRIDYITRASSIAQELRDAQQRSNQAQRIASLGHIEWNLDRQIVHCSQGVREILMLPDQTALTDLDNFLDCVHAEDKARVESAVSRSLSEGNSLNLEHRVVRPDGSIRFVLQVAGHRPGSKASDRMLVTLQDITARIDSEKQIHALAYYDELTGLPNRSFLIQYLDQILKSNPRHQTTTAVIVLGLDRFDKLVEGLDHESAESLVQMIAERLKNSCRDSDILSRHSHNGNDEGYISYQQLTAKLRSDEYVIVLSEISSPQAASAYLQRMREQFKKPFEIMGRKVYVSTSAGISLAPFDGSSTNQLIKFAEIAKGFANKKSAVSFRYFKQEFNDQVNRNVSLANDLRKALKQGALEVYYQPKIRLIDDSLAGVEALCRWNHPTLGAISPTEFIDIAEEENLIGELGGWVLKSACEQLMEWRAEWNCDFGVSVNISPRQLLDGQAMKHIVEYFRHSPIENQIVEFELTESTFLSNYESSLKALNQLIRLGCGLAIDDFGTGYSSLSYLGQLPAKTLKIDKSFIHLIDSDKQYTAIVDGIIKLAHSLGMTVIAEGVENAVQEAILAQAQCDEIQGSLVSMPLPPGEFALWWDDRKVRRMNSDAEFEAAESITQWH